MQTEVVSFRADVTVSRFKSKDEKILFDLETTQYYSKIVKTSPIINEIGWPSSAMTVYLFETESNALESTRQVYNISNLLRDLGGLMGSIMQIVTVALLGYQTAFHKVALVSESFQILKNKSTHVNIPKK